MSEQKLSERMYDASVGPSIGPAQGYYSVSGIDVVGWAEEVEALEARLEATERLLLDFYRPYTSTNEGAREIVEKDLAAPQQEQEDE